MALRLQGYQQAPDRELYPEFEVVPAPGTLLNKTYVYYTVEEMLERTKSERELYELRDLSKEESARLGRASIAG